MITIVFVYINENSLYCILVIESDEHEYNLIKDLLKEYNRFARPSVNHTEPTNVTFELSLSKLIDVVGIFYVLP